MMGKYYFVSDAHIGSDIVKNKKEHQRALALWLDMAKKDATEIFLVGDIFDFWYEFKQVIPKGYDRILGKLQEIVESGIPIHLFLGNHDMWDFGYLSDQIGLTIHQKPETMELNGKKVFISHGHDLCNNKLSVRFMHSVFNNQLLRKAFALFNPNLGTYLGKMWSNANRRKHRNYDDIYLGEDKEPLVLFAKQYCSQHHIELFVFGHRHILLNLQITKNSQVIVLGDFISKYSYAVLDSEGVSTHYFDPTKA